MENSAEILLIDDDSDDIEIVREVFVELRIAYSLKAFRHASEALLYVQTTEQLPILIFCDYNMPLMTGLDVIRALKGHERRNIREIPVILITTGASPRTVQQCYDSNVNGVILKPSQFDKMSEIVRNTIEYWTRGLSPKDYA